MGGDRERQQREGGPDHPRTVGRRPDEDEAEQDHDGREDIGHDLAGEPRQARQGTEPHEQREERSPRERDRGGSKGGVHDPCHQQSLRERQQPQRARARERDEEDPVRRRPEEEPGPVPPGEVDGIVEVVAGVRVGQREPVVERHDARHHGGSEQRKTLAQGPNGAGIAVRHEMLECRPVRGMQRRPGTLGPIEADGQGRRSRDQLDSGALRSSTQEPLR